MRSSFIIEMCFLLIVNNFSSWGRNRWMLRWTSSLYSVFSRLDKAWRPFIIASFSLLWRHSLMLVMRELVCPYWRRLYYLRDVSATPSHLRSILAILTYACLCLGYYSTCIFLLVITLIEYLVQNAYKIDI